jgi:hypothetical protein
MKRFFKTGISSTEDGMQYTLYVGFTVSSQPVPTLRLVADNQKTQKNTGTNENYAQGKELIMLA